MRPPWKKPEPEPPGIAQRIGEHRVRLAIIGAATAIGLGGVLFRKRRSTAEVASPEDPPEVSAPLAPASDDPPLNAA